MSSVKVPWPTVATHVRVILPAQSEPNHHVDMEGGHVKELSSNVLNTDGTLIQPACRQAAGSWRNSETCVRHRRIVAVR